MNFLGVGFNSKSKGYLTYNPNSKSKSGYFLESKCLGIWKLMIRRVYKELPGYEDCKVSDDWLDFQNFADFYYNDPWRQEGWHLDKDILVKDNKIYSPTTCCFVPQVVNTIIGNYKGIVNRKFPDLPTGVSIHSKTGLYRARVNDADTGKALTKYFVEIKEAEEMYSVMKKEQIYKVLMSYKDQINPVVYQSLINRII